MKKKMVFEARVSQEGEKVKKTDFVMFYGDEEILITKRQVSMVGLNKVNVETVIHNLNIFSDYCFDNLEENNYLKMVNSFKTTIDKIVESIDNTFVINNIAERILKNNNILNAIMKYSRYVGEKNKKQGAYTMFVAVNTLSNIVKLLSTGTATPPSRMTQYVDDAANCIYSKISLIVDDMPMSEDIVSWLMYRSKVQYYPDKKADEVSIRRDVISSIGRVKITDDDTLTYDNFTGTVRSSVEYSIKNMMFEKEHDIKFYDKYYTNTTVIDNQTYISVFLKVGVNMYVEYIKLRDDNSLDTNTYDQIIVPSCRQKPIINVSRSELDKIIRSVSDLLISDEETNNMIQRANKKGAESLDSMCRLIRATNKDEYYLLECGMMEEDYEDVKNNILVRLCLGQKLWTGRIRLFEIKRFKI